MSKRWILSCIIIWVIYSKRKPYRYLYIRRQSTVVISVDQSVSNSKPIFPCHHQYIQIVLSKELLFPSPKSRSSTTSFSFRNSPNVAAISSSNKLPRKLHFRIEKLSINASSRSIPAPEEMPLWDKFNSRNMGLPRSIRGTQTPLFGKASSKVPNRGPAWLSLQCTTRRLRFAIRDQKISFTPKRAKLFRLRLRYRQDKATSRSAFAMIEAEPGPTMI
jgi:hypothetical protein